MESGQLIPELMELMNVMEIMGQGPGRSHRTGAPCDGDSDDHRARRGETWPRGGSKRETAPNDLGRPGRRGFGIAVLFGVMLRSGDALSSSSDAGNADREGGETTETGDGASTSTAGREVLSAHRSLEGSKSTRPRMLKRGANLSGSRCLVASRSFCLRERNQRTFV